MATEAVELNVQVPEAFGFLFDPPLGQLRYRGAYGGRGSAKSWQFARALLVKGAEQKRRILCAREFQNSIADSVLALLAEQIALCGFGDFYSVDKTSIVGVNGTDFLFKGLRHNVRGIKSLEGVDIAWVEEGEAVSDESWETLIPTVRKENSEIWVSFNVALETDPTYQRFVVTPPHRSDIRRVSYKDNPWLPQVLREEAYELRKRDPEAYANVWGGEPWTRSDAEVLAGKWTVDEFVPKPHWLGPYFGADWGFARDPSVLVKLWIADSRLYIEHEEGGVQLDMDDTERSFRRIPGAGDHTIRADSARPETINEMVRRKLKVIPAKKWEGSVKDGIEHLRSYEQIVIHPRCKRAQTEARLWRYKTDPRTSDVLPALMPGNDHVWDAVRYGLQPMISQMLEPRTRMLT